MPLKNLCTKYLNTLVYVLPVDGFGWCRIDPSEAPDHLDGAIITPQPFHVLVAEFHYFNGKIVAGVGIVDELGHISNKEWVAFCIRDRSVDMYNLTTCPGKYNVSIGNNKPVIKIDLDVPMPQWMQFSGPPIASGFGFIAESDVWIKKKYDWLK